MVYSSLEDRQAGRQAGGQAGRQAGRQGGREAGREAGKERWTEKGRGYKQGQVQLTQASGRGQYQCADIASWLESRARYLSSWGMKRGGLFWRNSDSPISFSSSWT